MSKCGKNGYRNVKSESVLNEKSEYALTRYNKVKISRKTLFGPEKSNNASDVMDGLTFENICSQQEKQSSQITKQYSEETQMAG